MTKSLLVLGFGGHGRTVADVAVDCGFEEIAFLDDDRVPSASKLENVLGPMSLMLDLLKEWPVAIVAVGNNAVRHWLFEKLGKCGYERANLVHPSAIVSRSATFGEGVFIGRGAVVGTAVAIGDATIINTRASIDHDCRIGAANHLAPGSTLSGDVMTGDRVWLGTGCSVLQRIQISSDVVVGAGAAVIENLEKPGTYIGVPARLMKR